jgi:hypothetical protein
LDHTPAETGRKGVEWIKEVENKEWKEGLLNTVMKPSDAKKAKKLLNGCLTVNL